MTADTTIPLDADQIAECTGFNAAWCPMHGDCRCPDQEHRGGRIEPGCPLHSLDTTHDGGWR